MKKIYVKYIYPILPILFYIGFYIVWFSPVIFSGKILAPGDGLKQVIPDYYSTKTLWTTMLFSGWPTFADPLSMNWYPPQILFSVLKISLNYLVIFGYVIASSLTYLLVHELTKSKIAGFIAGLIFGTCGFLMAHLGHIYLVQSAAWLPGIIWGLEKLKAKFNYRWFVLTSLFVAMNILGGQPQIFTYSLFFAAIYVLITGYKTPKGRLRYYLLALAAVFLGIGLAGVQLIPAYELSKLSVRAKMDFSAFAYGSSDVKTLATLFFPYLFGGGTGTSFYKDNYLLFFDYTELTGYIGLTSLILALTGLFSDKKNKQLLFWGEAAGVCILLVLGSNFPLAQILFHIPGMNLFRISSRHFLEFSLAISVLAGYGIGAMQKLEPKKVKALLNWALGIIIFVFMVYLSTILIFKNSLTKGVLDTKAPWKNLAILVPFLILLTNVFLFINFTRINKKIKFGIIAILIIIDLASFGQFCEWKNPNFNQKTIISNSKTTFYSETLIAKNQRFFSLNGVNGNLDEIPTNLTKLWKIPNAGGYNSLMLTRYGEFLNIDSGGILQGSPYNYSNLAYDMLGIRYFSIEKNLDGSDKWAKENLNVTLNKNSEPLKITVATRTASQISIISSLGNSIDINNGEIIAEVEITIVGGKTIEIPIKAGEDTAEGAWDRQDVRSVVKHARAQVFESSPWPDASGTIFEAHNYLATFKLGGSYQIKNIKFKWAAGGAGKGILQMNIFKISLFDAEKGVYYPIEMTDILAGEGHVVYRESKGNAVIYENKRVLPRAWLVQKVLCLKPEEILAAVHTAKLPNGEIFKPEEEGLVEIPLQLKAVGGAFDGKVQDIKIKEEKISLKTYSGSQAFLVLSDIYYPGWKAYIDGQETKVYPTDYVLRGVLVPKGEHVIEFEFKPTSLYFGEVISGLVILFFLSGAIIFLKKNKKILIK